MNYAQTVQCISEFGDKPEECEEAKWTEEPAGQS